MKKLTFLTILAALAVVFSFGKLSAQVNIGADVAPKSFSVLELQGQYEDGIYGGLRLPQLTTAQRNAITGLNIPEAVGLTIFNTTTNCIDYWDGADWISLCDTDLPQLTTTQRNTMSVGWNNSNSGFMIFNTTTNCIEYWNGTDWISLCDTGLPQLTTTQRNTMSVGWDNSNSGFMIFNTTTNCIEYWNGTLWRSTDLPQLTTTQRNTMSVGWNNSNSGFRIFNTTTNCIDYWNGTLWRSLCSTDTSLPLFTTTERNNMSEGWNNSVFGFRIYNTTINCIEYWNGTQWIALCGGGSGGDPGAYNGQICGAYIAPNVWKKWMCRNLGADPNADPLIPSDGLNGDYYIWGSSTPHATLNTILHNYFPWNLSGGWYGNNSSAPDVKVKGPDDPCPAGYRVPTYDELQGLISNNASSWISAGDNSGRQFRDGTGGVLFFPANGRRYPNNGGLSDRGTWGGYWTSRMSDYVEEEYGYEHSHLLFINSTNASIAYEMRQFGMGIRCISMH